MKQIIKDPNIIVDTLDDGAIVQTLDKKGRTYTKLRLGPNAVHAFIRRKNGDIEDLGVSYNLLTNTGRDLWAATFGHATNFSGAATALAAGPPITVTSSGFAGTDSYRGWRVFMPITAITTAPTYANICKNTTTVLTVDQFWTAADGVSSNPAGTNGIYIVPVCAPRFMGLTTDTTGPAATDTTLTGEQTGNGLARARATYAHTTNTATYTMQVVYSVTGPVTAVHKMALFSSLALSVLADSGVMVFATNLNQDATVGSGDTLTVTDTVTLTG